MTFFKDGFSSTLGVGRSSKLGAGTGKICQAITLNEDITIDLVGTFERVRVVGGNDIILDTSTATTQVTREGFRRLLQRTFLFSQTFLGFSIDSKYIKASTFSALSFEDTVLSHSGWDAIGVAGAVFFDAVDLPPVAVPAGFSVSFNNSSSLIIISDVLGVAWITFIPSTGEKHLWCMSIMDTPLDLTFPEVDFDAGEVATWRFNGHYRLVGV